MKGNLVFFSIQFYRYIVALMQLLPDHTNPQDTARLKFMVDKNAYLQLTPTNPQTKICLRVQFCQRT